MLKKSWSYVVIALFLFSSAYWTGRGTRSFKASPITSIEKTTMSVDSVIFPHRQKLSRSSMADVSLSLKPLFQKTYSELQSTYVLEVTERLMTLKKLGPLRRLPSSTAPGELRGFYEMILQNPKEHWLVQRQAFINLKGVLSAEEKQHYYAKLDTRVLALAAKSEQDILEEVLSAK